MAARKKTSVTKKKATVTVIQSDPPIQRKVLADHIIALGNAVSDMEKSSRLNKKAIIILLHHSTGLSQRDIKTVLDALPELKRLYCTQ